MSKKDDILSIISARNSRPIEEPKSLMTLKNLPAIGGNELTIGCEIALVKGLEYCLNVMEQGHGLEDIEEPLLKHSAKLSTIDTIVKLNKSMIQLMEYKRSVDEDGGMEATPDDIRDMVRKANNGEEDNE